MDLITPKSTVMILVLSSKHGKSHDTFSFIINPPSVYDASKTQTGCFLLHQTVSKLERDEV